MAAPANASSSVWEGSGQLRAGRGGGAACRLGRPGLQDGDDSVSVSLARLKAVLAGICASAVGVAAEALAAHALSVLNVSRQPELCWHGLPLCIGRLYGALAFLHQSA